MPTPRAYHVHMLAPSIRYARTVDNVSVACAAIGSGGTPVIALRPPESSHLGFEFTLPMETRHHEFERMAAHRTVVRFDPRGAGLSDRGVADLSLDARLRDIDAVADHLGLATFAIQASLQTCAWAIAYAASRPGRVTHLALHQPYLSGANFWDEPGRRALESLISVDWLTYTEAAMSHAFGWAPGDIPRALATQMRAAMTPEDFLAYLRAERLTSVEALLPQIACPVLVVHCPPNMLAPRDLALRVAASVPDGRLALPTSFDQYLDELNGFFDLPGAESDAAPPADGLSLRVVLVADAEAGPGELGAAIASHGGHARAVDGISLGVFRSAQDALHCARALATATGASVGIHGSEPGPGTPSEADPSIVTAARAVVAAAPGQVVVTNIVRELVAGKGFGFAELPSSRSAGPERLFALHPAPSA